MPINENGRDGEWGENTSWQSWPHAFSDLGNENKYIYLQFFFPFLS